ncbi:response regulator [candidate division CSSED10-310 bacterium]|uniref:Response regulator n=1 Tax=candidate division CSSED10-310 bacterium TaxID=2855610 RepID=A0ABV6YWA1_UNCC1
MPEVLNVLILDDEPIVGKRLKPGLAKIGCEVEVFTDPKEAYKRIDEKKFQIVVTDIYMPEIDGFQIMKHALERWDQTKVIVITGYAMMEVARTAMEKGAFDFIAKPFTPADLRAMITKAGAALGVELPSTEPSA